jgi:hypothetical protein
MMTFLSKYEFILNVQKQRASSKQETIAVQTAQPAKTATK